MTKNLIQEVFAMIQDPPAEAAPERPRSRRRLRTAFDVRTERRRWLSYALLAGSLVLLVNAVVGDNGYLATLRARRDYDSLMSALTRLQNENERLRDEALRLKTDPATLEEAARRELGLVRPGETLVIIKDARPSGAPATDPGPGAAASTPR
jgi:cell division protein FtsB